METFIFAAGPQHIYLVFFLLLMGGAIGLPVPEDIPLLFAGAAVQQAIAKPLPLFIVCYVGVMLGDVIIYLLGRWFGKRLYQRPWFKKHFPLRRIRRIRRGLEGRAFLSILVARHLFYLRSITFFTCGLVRMRFLKFFVADAFAALISATIMMSIGFVASEHLESAMQKVGMVKNWTLMILGLIVVGVIIHFLIRHYAQSTNGEEAANSDSGEIERLS